MGAGTLGLALSSLVLVLDKGLEWGWTSVNSSLCYLSILVFLTIFIQIEKKHPEPLVDFKFFKISAFVHTLINNFLIFMGMMGGIFLIPIFAQTFLGYDATQTGYLFIPMAFIMVASSPVGVWLGEKMQPRFIIAISTFIAGIGLFLFSFLDPRSSAWGIILPLSIMAFGMGLGMAQRTNIIASIVPMNEIGIASSILALARNIAGAFGIAIFGTLLSDATNSNVLSIASHSAINSVAIGLKPVTAYLPTFISLVILKAQISAYDTVFAVSSLFLFAGAFLALLIKVKKINKLKEEIIVE